ncbi:mpv17-like protein 2 [Vanessa cardui]|uniref:mpv17-like protein 2 n=1 Tax=Vanessa cardui TaxID=171605 RepID=UPI001F13AA0C|nr:mpv17-like protein 2 [Vanessa cardui]
MQALGLTWRRITSNLRSLGVATGARKVVNVAFSDKYLLYTNVTISVTLSSIGDIMEQTYEIYTKQQDKYNPKRTMHMAFSGAAVGVLCHHWYKVLDKFIIGKTFDMVAKKLLLDQLIFSPIMIVTFFGSLALFEKDPVGNFKEEVRDKFVTLYHAEWLVWPPAQIINFYFLPTKYRVLYDNTISLGYDVYTSQVKHKKSIKIPPQDSKSS